MKLPATVKDQNGLVSLFTTIGISMLLMIVTLSLISLEALQLRKAEDAEQTLRAYYAAESGVEDAVSKVLSKQVSAATGNQPCVENIFDADGVAGWTCQQISFSGSPFGQLDTPDVAKTIDPGPGPNYNSVEIEWNQDNSNAASKYDNCLNAGGAFPSQAAWTKCVAPIEVTIVEYPDNQFSAATDARLYNALIVPGGASGGANSGNVTYTALRGHGPWFGKCGPLSNGYNCRAIITGLTGKNYIFRLRTRYLPSSYRMTFWESAVGNGNKVDVPDGTATIDVTAKAGQAYRRVISKLPITAGASGRLNYVLYSDTDICKNFNVVDNAIPTPAPAGAPSSGCSWPW